MGGYMKTAGIKTFICDVHLTNWVKYKRSQIHEE